VNVTGIGATHSVNGQNGQNGANGSSFGGSVSEEVSEDPLKEA
jgi:hypothetical protein